MDRADMLLEVLEYGESHASEVFLLNLCAIAHAGGGYGRFSFLLTCFDVALGVSSGSGGLMIARYRAP